MTSGIFIARREDEAAFTASDFDHTFACDFRFRPRSDDIDTTVIVAVEIERPPRHLAHQEIFIATSFEQKSEVVHVERRNEWEQ